MRYNFSKCNCFMLHLVLINDIMSGSVYKGFLTLDGLTREYRVVPFNIKLWRVYHIYYAWWSWHLSQWVTFTDQPNMFICCCFSRLSQLMARFDEVRASGDMMPTAVLSVGTTHEGRTMVLRLTLMLEVIYIWRMQKYLAVLPFAPCLQLARW